MDLPVRLVYRMRSLFSCSARSAASRSSSCFFNSSCSCFLLLSSSAWPLSKFSFLLSSKVTVHRQSQQKALNRELDRVNAHSKTCKALEMHAASYLVVSQRFNVPWDKGSGSAAAGSIGTTGAGLGGTGAANPPSKSPKESLGWMGAAVEEVEGAEDMPLGESTHHAQG
jgi:hypothetical protein